MWAAVCWLQQSEWIRLCKDNFEKAGIPQADYLYFTRKEIYGDVEGVVDKIEEKFHILYL